LHSFSNEAYSQIVQQDTVSCKTFNEQVASNSYPSVTKRDWAEDIKCLYRQLSEKHINLFHFTPKTVFEQKVKQLLEALPSLDDHEIFLRIKQIVSLAGDGHTFICEPSTYHQFPLHFFEFSDGLKVINRCKI
jgi:hypothetical protein